MDHTHPIHTLETQCQDCYKCLRHCPVKAIRVSNGHAMIIPEMCVACGTCVAVCPVKAKRIRNDLGRARRLVSGQRPVYASLAPSWLGQFSSVRPEIMVAAIRRLGFAGVSETALGAQEVSAAVAELMRSGQDGVFISSACPASVDFLRKYMTPQAEALTPVHSPLLAHCELLRKEFGSEIGVVFFGPCIAKKLESDRQPGLLDIALTFDDLKTWLEEEGLSLETIQPEADEHFVPRNAEEGALYPVEGGMSETVKAHTGLENARYITLTGLCNIQQGLTDLSPESVRGRVMVETLACMGGCVGGPCMSAPDGTLLRRLRVEEQVSWPPLPLTRQTSVPVREAYPPDNQVPALPVAADLDQALRTVGKQGPDDELNCGGCGYYTCREFAAALLDGRAEPGMCVSHMRTLAQRKANALLSCFPSGVVIVDRALRIVECNEHFGRMFGEEVAEIYEMRNGLDGCLLSRVVPFPEMFEKALETGREVRSEHHRCGNQLFNISIFTLDPHQVVGGVVMDVTRQEFRREQIAQRANEVISRNLSTVQEIACRLGEHMADTEILLREIAEGFGSGDPGPRRDWKGEA